MAWHGIEKETAVWMNPSEGSWVGDLLGGVDVLLFELDLCMRE